MKTISVHYNSQATCPSSSAPLGYILCLVTLIALNSGCQSLTTTKKWDWPWSKTGNEPQIPDRILPIWTDTIMHQPGKPGIRGFGGRVYFYSGEETDAIEVDGGLVVYVFDSDNMDPHSPTPEKKYVFTPEHMKNHVSEAPLGKSYSIWLPWDEVGGESRSLTLVTRFEGTKGGVVLSQPAVKFLPGVTKKENLSAVQSKDGQAPLPFSPTNPSSFSDGSAVQPASYQQDAGEIRWSNSHELSSMKEASRRRETQTIDLPPSFYRHLNAPAESPLADPFLDQSKRPNTTSTETNPPVAIPNVDSPAIANPVSNIPMAKTSDMGTTESNSGDQSPQANTLTRYPFRHVPGTDGGVSHGSLETTVTKNRPNRREPTKGGWLESLPKTPRTP